MKIICQFVKVPKTFIICARNISRRFPSFLIAFAQIFPLLMLLPEFRENAMANSGKKQWQIRAKAIANSGKSNGKSWTKAMRKLGKRRHIFRAKITAFARITHYFSPNFPLLLPQFPIAFARISHCFCPIFLFPPPPPPASYAYAYDFGLPN